MLACIRHWAFGIAYALQPRRAHEIIYIVLVLVRDCFGRRRAKPETWVRKPIDAAGGLVFISSDLSVANLIAAYSNGIFPYCHIGPMKWWSPPKRMLLKPSAIKIEKDTRRLLKSDRLDVRFDHSFRNVVAACAEPRPGRLHLTWISPTIIEAFTSLHEAGYAHSVEIYEDGALVGGLYGVAIGRVFFIESQFSRRRNASKVALVALNAHLSEWNFEYHDGKAHTPHLERCGFALMDRKLLKEALQSVCAVTAPSEWQFSREILLRQLQALG
jgi:leucyl/phenylalanyl-tRNA--protein transferase